VARFASPCGFMPHSILRRFAALLLSEIMLDAID
jgi:hypothetical protein